MANASVDKFKDLALRHGEKLVVAGAAGLCIWFIMAGLGGETVDVTPDQVKSNAANAAKNVKRPVDRDELAKQMKPKNSSSSPTSTRRLRPIANHEPLSVKNGLQSLLSTLDPTGGVLA